MIRSRDTAGGQAPWGDVDHGSWIMEWPTCMIRSRDTAGGQGPWNRHRKCMESAESADSAVHRRFQTRASPGIARVKLWSIVLIAYHYVVLQDVVQSPLTKARRLGGGTGFFSAHKPTASAARVACPGNPAALKPPLGTKLAVVRDRDDGWNSDFLWLFY